MALFESSTNVSTNIAIYPNTGDSWDVLSPFPGETLGVGEEAFVFSDASSSNDGSLHLLPSRLIDVGKVGNEVNFLAKTNLESKTIPTTQGIGGMSKLKDFSFTITKDYLGSNPMDQRDIINLYGRKVILFVCESNAVEDPDDAGKSDIVFSGRIHSVTRPNTKELKWTVRGLLNTANPLVGGPVVEQSDGSQSNEAIVIGDSGDVYIPISKKENADGTTSLQWTQDDKYIIKSLHVKAGTDDEPIWLDIETPYDIINDEIVFNPTEYTSVKLTDAVPAGERISKIRLQNYHEVAFHLKKEPDPPDFVVGQAYGFTGSIHPNQQSSGVGALLAKYNNKLIYIRSEEIEEEMLHFFRVGWEFVYGDHRSKIEAGSWKVGSATVYPYIIKDKNALWPIDYAVTYKVAPLEKETDALGRRFNPSSPYPNFMERNEQKDLINRWGADSQTPEAPSDKTFQQIPKDPLLIQIDDEKMLVVYTEKDTGYPTTDFAPDAPTDMYAWVIRGYAGTDIASHADNAPVKLFTNISDKIIYTLKKRLKGLTTATPSTDWVFLNMKEWLEDTNDFLAVYNYAGIGVESGEHDPSGFIGLDWDLPDLTGDIHEIVMTGVAVCGEDLFDKEPWLPNKSRMCFINLALHTVATGDETEWDEINFVQRRAVGEIQKSDPHSDDVYKIAQWRIEPDEVTDDRTFNGAYRFKVKTTYDFKRSGQYLTTNANFFVHHKTNNYDILDYEELRETSMYMVFNGMNQWNHRSIFTVSKPILEVKLKNEIGNLDIYAKVIPKNLFTDPTDEFPVGANCKIAWHYADYYANNMDIDPVNLPNNMFMVSDDDNLGFTRVYLEGGGLEFGFITPNPNTDYPGFLVRDLIRPNGVGKFYPTQNLKEDYILPGIDPDNYVRQSGYDSGLLDAGKIFLENDNAYIWVDQANNKVKIVEKVIVDKSNPVAVIQEILQTFYTDVTLDTAAFTKAIEQRLSWEARVLVTKEKPLIGLVDEIAKNHGLLVYEDDIGRMTTVALDPPAEEEVTDDIDDTMLIFKDAKKASLLDFKEKWTEMDYIITELDVYYDFFGTKFQKYIASADLSNQDDFVIAEQFTENPIKLKLQLKSVFSQGTADKSAIIKMVYHQIPTRILKVKTTLSTSNYKVGQWVTCTTSKIEETSGKIYLILGKRLQVPWLKKRPHVELTLFEYDWDAIKLRIQEVPTQTIVDNYDEVVTDIEKIDEVPNA